VLTSTDRNGNVHTFTYDILGRQTIDAVTTLGSGVDGAVRRIETEYDTQGNGYKLTSYDASTSGSVVNQIQREFDGLGNLLTEWQAAGGAVNTSTSPKVQYAYSFAPSGSTNHNRLTSITYPNGRVITYNYASGLNADISRLTSISDGGTTLESYEYLGYGTVVKRGHTEPAVDLNYVKYSGESNGDAGDQYAGLDRFGRIVDQRWTTSTPTAKDRRQYGYDRDSNRLYMDNIVETTRSELYAYDGFNQLTSMDRGTLNGGKNGLTGAASRAQDWDYDGLGNWDSLTTDGGSAVTRGHNKQNEITSISGASTPTYDANGNLLTDETGKQFVYDAWNRLAIVKSSGGSTLATYKYDATGRRVRETRSGVTTDLYYTSQWQVIEERVSGTTRLSYVWSPVYVDAMIARDRDSDSNGSLEERLYVVHDANFNIVALLDTSGNVVERFAYDAYGVFTVLTPGWGARGSSSYAWNYLHQGGRWDADGTVYSFRLREYSPTLGRWFQCDPLGLTANELILYRAYRNRPLTLTDSTGLDALDTWRSLAMGGQIQANLPLDSSIWNDLTNKEKDTIREVVHGVFDLFPRDERNKTNLAQLKQNLLAAFGKNLRPEIAVIPFPAGREGLFLIGPNNPWVNCANLILTAACQASLLKAREFIGELGSKAFPTREKASKNLAELITNVSNSGSPACLFELRNRLISSSKSSDEEVSNRSKVLVGKIEEIIRSNPAGAK